MRRLGIRRAATVLVTVAAAAALSVGVYTLTPAQKPPSLAQAASALVVAAPANPVPSNPALTGTGSTLTYTSSSSAARATAPVPTGEPSAPTRIRIPALHIDAPVISVGTAPDGALDVPSNVGTIGWDRYTVKAGSPAGSTLVAGHVDGGGRRGALWSLATAKPGMVINVATATGAQNYRIAAVQRVPKDGLPADITSADGAHRLVLVTCGGAFNRSTRHYKDNVIVYADAV